MMNPCLCLGGGGGGQPLFVKPPHLIPSKTPGGGGGGGGGGGSGIFEPLLGVVLRHRDAPRGAGAADGEVPLVLVVQPNLGYDHVGALSHAGDRPQMKRGRGLWKIQEKLCTDSKPQGRHWRVVNLNSPHCPPPIATERDRLLAVAQIATEICAVPLYPPANQHWRLRATACHPEKGFPYIPIVPSKTAQPNLGPVPRRRPAKNTMIPQKITTPKPQPLRRLLHAAAHATKAEVPNSSS